jgi:hypothetical protein
MRHTGQGRAVAGLPAGGGRLFVGGHDFVFEPRTGEVDVTIAIAIVAGRFADAGQGSAGGAGTGVGQAIEFFVDQPLHRPQLFLDAAALLEQHADLFINSLQRGHAAMGTLKKGDGGGGARLGSGEIVCGHEGDSFHSRTRPIHRPAGG